MPQDVLTPNKPIVLPNGARQLSLWVWSDGHGARAEATISDTTAGLVCPVEFGHAYGYGWHELFAPLDDINPQPIHNACGGSYGNNLEVRNLVVWESPGNFTWSEAAQGRIWLGAMATENGGAGVYDYRYGVTPTPSPVLLRPCRVPSPHPHPRRRQPRRHPLRPTMARSTFCGATITPNRMSLSRSRCLLR